MNSFPAGVMFTRRTLAKTVENTSVCRLEGPHSADDYLKGCFTCLNPARLQAAETADLRSVSAALPGPEAASISCSCLTHHFLFIKKRF